MPSSTPTQSSSRPTCRTQTRPGSEKPSASSHGSPIEGEAAGLVPHQACHMEPGAASLILATVFLWGVVSARLAVVSTPIIFVAAGLIYSEVLGVLDLGMDPHLIKGVAEITLVWVLFADASRIKPHEMRADLGLYVRLLGVGLPLTVGLGMVGGMALLDLDAWHALLLGAALAPTDAALGSAVMSDQRVP